MNALGKTFGLSGSALGLIVCAGFYLYHAKQQDKQAVAERMAFLQNALGAYHDTHAHYPDDLAQALLPPHRRTGTHADACSSISPAPPGAGRCLYTRHSDGHYTLSVDGKIRAVYHSRSKQLHFSYQH